ncbi:hypothetical protein FGO68_gene1211 [Halteria grandinella]|uniref:EF-hand domain-containing protein n=1 Tax=Halteria grandinella TaxID=5974 RepID=A0A8J8NN90_HALGN|nr:hypothetical protein FGO68_gene1211 [Halteria grandinella]
MQGLVGLRATAESQVDGVFSTIDANGDNQLSKEEWARHLEGQGVTLQEHELDMIMALLDTDKSGFVSKEEFAAYAKAIDEAYPEDAESLIKRLSNNVTTDHDTVRWDERDKEQYDKGFEDARIKMVFEFFDDDHNDVLSRAEMKEFMVELYDHALTDEQLDTAIAYCDTNFDGAVSYDELYVFVV